MKPTLSCTVSLTLLLISIEVPAQADKSGCFVHDGQRIVMAPSQAMHDGHSDGTVLLEVASGHLLRWDGNGRFRSGFNGEGPVEPRYAFEDGVLYVDSSPAERLPMDEQHIEISRDGFVLAATVKRLANAPAGPGVIFIHGSGPQRRYAGTFGLNAQRMACSGFAALAYDKRGTGASGGAGLRAELPQLVGDARAVITAFRGYPGMSDQAIGLWGHSQGGWVAPVAANADGKLAYLVVAGAPAVSVWEQNILNLRDWVRRDSGSLADAAIAEATARQMYEVAESGTGLEELQKLEHLTAGENWRSWFTVETDSSTLARWRDWDPAETLSSLETPTLVMIGELDTSVPPMENLYLWRRYLRKAGNFQFDSREIEGADHALFMVNGPLNPHGMTESPSHLSVDSGCIVADFLVQHLGHQVDTTWLTSSVAQNQLPPCPTQEG